MFREKKRNIREIRARCEQRTRGETSRTAENTLNVESVIIATLIIELYCRINY